MAEFTLLPLNMDRVMKLVNDALECERKWESKECLEKCLYHGSGGLPRVALFGAGADMKHLELQKRCLTIDVIYLKLDSMDDKEFLVSSKTLPLVVYVLFISSPALTRKVLTRERGSR